MYVERQFKITTFPMKCLMLVQDDHLILRGGGGRLANLVRTYYYFDHGLGQKIYFQVNRGQITSIYFQLQQFFEKAIKKGVSARVV